MLDTGIPPRSRENEFLRARRHQVLATLMHRLSRQVESITLGPAAG
jgi:hypothetical protein